MAHCKFNLSPVGHNLENTDVHKEINILLVKLKTQMSDAAERREARRKRILENAETRLSRILSREKQEDADDISLSNNHTRSVSFQDVNSIQENEVSNVNNDQTEQLETTEDVRTIFINPSRTDVESISEAEFVDVEGKLNRRHIVIIILALMMRYVLLLCEQYALYFFQADILHLHLNKIFLPFLAYEIIEFFYFPVPIQRSNLLMTFFMFKMNPRYAQKLLIAIGFINKFSKDFMLYFFTFCVFEFVIDFIQAER